MNIKFPEPPPGSLIRFHHRGYVRFAYRQLSINEKWQVTGSDTEYTWGGLEIYYPDIKNGDWRMVQTNAVSGPG